MLHKLLNIVRKSNVPPDKKNHLENFFGICLDLEINNLEGPFEPEECAENGIAFVEGKYSYFLKQYGLHLISKQAGCVDVVVLDNKCDDS